MITKFKIFEEENISEKPKYVFYSKEKGREFTFSLDTYKDMSHSLTLHRENAPAFIFYDKNGMKILEEWWINGEMIKETMYSDITGVKTYDKYVDNGKIHRENGPARIKYFYTSDIRKEYLGNKKTVEYWKDNGYHRLDGPAVLEYHPNGVLYDEKFYIDNKFFNSWNDWLEQLMKKYPKEYKEYTDTEEYSKRIKNKMKKKFGL
jgi:hypothetical protein